VPILEAVERDLRADRVGSQRERAVTLDQFRQTPVVIAADHRQRVGHVVRSAGALGLGQPVHPEVRHRPQRGGVLLLRREGRVEERGRVAKGHGHVTAEIGHTLLRIVKRGLLHVRLP